MTATNDTGGSTPAEPELGYEEAREQLNAVVRQLESGGLTLKDSLALWERGERLARVCEEWLEGARAKLAVALAEKEPEGSGTADTEAPF
ncbi:exodeoxyribonuclease VII small subunit [Marinitenerispora sediminis]|uniref:Exodeoxyribonuclease 7 small subunit n=1 Tax=Marinitenerispora sediminis TaxID=1931232 RepID=A0A368TB67_9ACTN|nr:exodeoxyribonuclease VII small subunit [Marinitenerispora sediminis]RCV54389.1 exodeoxyribonuclease VII small subunit [Marinitenerispora sediminis]RCV61118.1 exodeoxyribonuclease VII small subunit [Marinitenerispora sediminis]RCV62394.1 exodeoxyribonuclease VII small subunit [Marinitenerispora sediminis]